MKQVFAQSITPEEITGLQPCRFPGEIILIDDPKDVNAACNYLLSQKVIGFDTETRPCFTAGQTNRVALLQLSTNERCYLFRLCKMRLDKAIIKVLESKDVIKVGAAVHGDLHAIGQLRHLKPGGFIDLQDIVGQWGITDKSVRKMAALVLGQRVSKAQRLSNWESSELTPSQRQYASTDAWVCLRIYQILNSIDDTN